jgi:hypothetical protein
MIIINYFSLRTCKCSSEWNPLDCCYLVHGQEVRARMIVFGTLDKVMMYNNFTKHSKYIVNIWWNHINYVGRTNILIWHLHHIYSIYVCVSVCVSMCVHVCVCDLYVQKYMCSQVSHMEYLSTTLRYL